MNLTPKAKIIIMLALFTAVYWPTFVWMNARFLEADTYYSHGFLAPFVFAYLVWIKRDELERCEISPQAAGLFILIPTLLIHLLAYLLEINFISGFSIIAALFGISLCLYGVNVTKILIFPILFLVFMIPLPQVMIIGISFKMKIFAAQAAASIVKIMGIKAFREGSIIFLPNTSLTVGDPCSGLRSLISLTALGALYAYLAKLSPIRKTILFLISIPVALAANIARIALLLLVAFVYGAQVATGKFHDFSGFLLFIFALAGLIIAGKALSCCARD
ncbi:MAG: exosortase/archaeosortase family protein [Candidatus Omnitrophota bacterium]